MESRKTLLLNGTLHLGEIEYHIEEIIGKGSCAILYRAWYKDATISDASHHVLIKELFPIDIKGGIYRDADDKINVLPPAEEHFSLYRKSFERGNKVHLKILETFPEKNGVNINTYSYNNTLYTVLGFGGGRDLETELIVSHEKGLLKVADRIIGVLSALEEFHKLGLYHLDISPDNILLIGKDKEERVALIDYNSVVSEEELKGKHEVFYSLKKGYTAPEMRSGMRYKISPSTDLYSVAAVFFRMIYGRTLTEFEMIQRTPPNISNCFSIQNEPETVKSMVRKILIKGLAQLPEKRYISVSEMKKDFEELKERILGIGITHWSLWESGRKTVQKIIENNTSLKCLKSSENLYSLNVQIGDEIKSTDSFFHDILTENSSVVLVGDGGIGKTTSLLNFAYNVNTKYTASSPAIIYISLYGAQPSDENFIKDKILETLRFTPDTKTFEMARHKLKHILKENFENTRVLPTVILLDGLNEINGNAHFIINEIKELSQNSGVVFIITTRQYDGEFEFNKACLIPLKDSEVQRVLSKEGLLIPQNIEIIELIRNPLMLSIFIEASKTEKKQLKISNKKELVSEYFSVISKKGIENINQNDGQFWLNDVCVNFVLPSIAEEIRRKKHALNDEEVFNVTKKCYRVLISKIIFKAFPRWIGHLNDILCGCKSAESWYGIVVKGILWKKTGLLSKNEFGLYRIFHQTIEDYLIEINMQNARKIRKRIIIKNTAIISFILASFVAVCSVMTIAFPELAEKSVFVRINAISKEKADELLPVLVTSYSYSGQIYDTANSLVDSIEDEALLNKFASYEEALNSKSYLLGVSVSKKMLDELESHEKVMHYSYKKINKTETEILLGKAAEDAFIYGRYITLIPVAKKENNLEYLSALKDFIRADSEYTAILFHCAAWQHITEMSDDSELKKTMLNSLSLIPKIENTRKQIETHEKNIDSYTATKYKEARRNAYDKMEQAYGKYEIMYKRK